MTVRLSDIPVEGLLLDYRHDPGLLEPLGDGIRLLEPVAVRLSILPVGDRYFIEGEVLGRVEVECGRCLAAVPLTVAAPCAIDVVPLARELVEDERGSLDRGELDVMFCSDEVLNLDDLVREQLLLNVPMRPLCRDGCLGLCPTCGKNRNLGACGCRELDAVDPRLEGLRRFRRRLDA